MIMIVMININVIFVSVGEWDQRILESRIQNLESEMVETGFI